MSTTAAPRTAGWTPSCRRPSRFLGDRAQLRKAASTLLAWQPDTVVDMFAMTEASGRDALSALADGVERWVLASSMDVYRAYGRLRGSEPGPPLEGPLVEDSPLRQRWYPYRGSGRKTPGYPIDDYDKIPIERAVLGHPRVEGVVLRLPAVCGPRDAQHRCGADLRRMDDGRPAILLGVAEAGWRLALGYVEDVGHALALAATYSAARGVFHVAQEPTRTRREFIEAIASATGWAGRIVTLPDDQLPSHLAPAVDYCHQMTADSSRIRDRLGFSEHISFADAIARTIAWERTHPVRLEASRFDYVAEDTALTSADAS